MSFPSSAEHCVPCAFNTLSPAVSEHETAAEFMIVKHHLTALMNEEATGTPSNEISGERVMPGRYCARAIFTGECPMFTYAQSLDKTVLIVRKTVDAN